VTWSDRLHFVYIRHKVLFFICCFPTILQGKEMRFRTVLPARVQQWEKDKFAQSASRIRQVSVTAQDSPVTNKRFTGYKQGSLGLTDDTTQLGLPKGPGAKAGSFIERPTRAQPI
jgi:hypothetical protein